MPEDPPTLGEVMRRLDSITEQLAAIVRELRQDRVDAASTYLRQDIWIRERDLINALLSDTRGDVTAVDTKVDGHHAQYKRDREGDTTVRRQMWMWIGGLAVTLLLGIGTLIVAVLTLVRS